MTSALVIALGCAAFNVAVITTLRMRARHRYPYPQHRRRY